MSESSGKSIFVACSIFVIFIIIFGIIIGIITGDIGFFLLCLLWSIISVGVFGFYYYREKTNKNRNHQQYKIRQNKDINHQQYDLAYESIKNQDTNTNEKQEFECDPMKNQNNSSSETKYIEIVYEKDDS